MQKGQAKKLRVADVWVGYRGKNLIRNFYELGAQGALCNGGGSIEADCRHGHRLDSADVDGVMRCPETGYRYKKTEVGTLKCLDLDEEAPLPAELSKGTKSYRDLKGEAEYEGTATRS